MTKPTIGQNTWGQTLNDHLDTLQAKASLDVDVTTKINDTASATRAALSATYEQRAALAQSFTSVPMWSFGNSWMASDTNNTGPSTRAVNIVKTALSPLYLMNRAADGYRMQDCAVRALSGFASMPAKQRGLVYVDALLNNLIEPDDTANRQAAEHSLRTLIAVACASQKVEADAASGWTYSSSPAWGANTQVATANASNGTTSYTTVDAAYAEVTIPTSGDYVMVCRGSDGVTSNSGIFTFTVGGTTVGVLDLQSTTKNTTLLNNDGSGPAAVRIPGLTAGQVLRATFSTAGRGAPVYGVLDVLLLQNPTPPLVVVATPMVVTKSTHTGKPALQAYLVSLPNAMRNEFGEHVVVSDGTSGWNTASMLGADGLHPNDLGMAQVASAVQNTLFQTIVSRARRSALGIGAVTLGGLVDNFDRPDSTTKLGWAGTLGLPGIGGKLWASSNTFGITSGRAVDVAPAAANHVAAVDAGFADGTFTVTLGGTADANLGACGLVIRYADDSNYIVALGNGKLYKNVAGVFTLLGGTQVNPTGDTKIQVVAQGQSIAVFINDVLVTTANSTAGQTNTKHGILNFQAGHNHYGFSAQP